VRVSLAIAAIAAVGFLPATAPFAVADPTDPTDCPSSLVELVKLRTWDSGAHDRVTLAERRSTDADAAAKQADVDARNAAPADRAAADQRARDAHAEADRRRAYVAEVDVDTKRNHGELVRISVLVDHLCNGNGSGGDAGPIATPVPVVPTVPGAPTVPGTPAPPTDVVPTPPAPGASTSQIGEVPGGNGVPTGGGALARYVA
jgi:hypothetical protein